MNKMHYIIDFVVALSLESVAQHSKISVHSTFRAGQSPSDPLQSIIFKLAA